MLFCNALRSRVFSSGRAATALVAGRRRAALMSTSSAPVEGGASSSGAGALLVAVGTTFCTYMTADFLSNFIQHPTQKVRVRV